MRGPDGEAAGLTTVHVPPLLPIDRSNFDWKEPPVAYPGERSSAAPASAKTVSAPAASAPKSAAPAVLPASTTPAAKSDATYVVRNGDTLADIAQRQLGSAKRWPELVKLNPGLDPKNLKIGTTIKLGGAAAAAPLAEAPAQVAPVKTTGDKALASAARTHTEVAGDTLGAIAKKYLGSTARANDVYDANRDVLSSPNALKIGQVLRIP
jgi:nucleoid-associated protein YgaU